MSRKPRERLVSVIVPAHNSAVFLDECIESVLAQTYRNWELIIVDDRSSDATADIAGRHALADSRIRVEQVDFGDVSSARNHGIRVARGELFCFLDSDDAYGPTALEAMAGAIDTSALHLELQSLFNRIVGIIGSAASMDYGSPDEDNPKD